MRLIARCAVLLLAACAAPAREQADTSAPGMSLNTDSSATSPGGTNASDSLGTATPPPSRQKVELERRDSTGRILGRDKAKPIDVNDRKRQLPTIQDTAGKVP